MSGSIGGYSQAPVPMLGSVVLLEAPGREYPLVAPWSPRDSRVPREQCQYWPATERSLQRATIPARSGRVSARPCARVARITRRIAGAVVQKLGIIGEAASHISNELTARHTEVPWPQIVAFRNMVIWGGICGSQHCGTGWVYTCRTWDALNQTRGYSGR